mmetsp:Transcript_23054/g.34928  ORF Transcript_23054/g.34928 Transcript_23054/m.34928 type:complete len:129 (+) Transcript_23054:167-553(+)
MQVYHSKVHFCPLQMVRVLRAALYNEWLFKDFCKCIRKKMFQLIMDGFKSLAYEDFEQLSVEAMADQILIQKSNAKRLTRSTQSTQAIIKADWREVRARQKREEEHIKGGFVEEAPRSVDELMFVISN